MYNPNDDIVVNNCPSEAISCIRFCPSSDVFAVTSWDNQITCYKYDDNLSTEVIGTNKHNRAALCCCWDISGRYIMSGGCDNNINIWHINGTFKTLGKHKSSVQCIEYAKNYNILISGSWDKTIKYWDIRSGNNCKTIEVGGKIYAMSYGGNSLVVGLSNKMIQHYDLRKCSKYITSELPGSYIKSKYKDILTNGTIRDIDIFPDKRGYIMVIMEGRGIVTHFNADERDKDFSWKCHGEYIKPKNKVYNVYSVNTIRFHREYKSFVTGGDDGVINVWEKDRKMRLRHFQQINYGFKQFASIVCTDFDRNGKIMGYATSYNWNKGIKYYQKLTKPQIYLHSLKPRDFT